MSPSKDARVRASRLVGLLVVLVVAAGCSGEGSEPASPTSSPAAASTTSIAVTDAVDQVPRSSPEEAVTAVLEAEQAGDHVTSFAVLSDAGRRLYKDQAEWQDRRNELPLITGFEIEETDDDQVTVLVSHDPGLDPFLGLSAAQERQVWTAVGADGGWLVDAEPDTDYVLPDDDLAVDAALEWVGVVQGCDEAAAVALQALPTLYGSSPGLAEVCGAEGTPSAGTVGNIDAGPASADIVAQYSSDALIWARTVPVTISGVSLTVVLAPIGDVWKVMGVSD